jgi:hypothetical protein
MAARLNRTYRHARRNLWRLTYMPWRRFCEKYGPSVTFEDIEEADLKRKFVGTFEHVGNIDMKTGEITTATGEVIGNVDQAANASNKRKVSLSEAKKGVKKFGATGGLAGKHGTNHMLTNQMPTETKPVTVEGIIESLNKYGATGGLTGSAEGLVGERTSESTISRDEAEKMKRTHAVIIGTGVDAAGAAATESSLADTGTTGVFKVGDAVEWTSSNKTKFGKIEQIIPAAMLPADFGFRLKDATTPRDHESYIVRTGPTAKEVYWPRVSLLKFSPTI